MNVFLDTNIVITGALNPYGPAHNLVKLASSVSFFTSQRVLQECIWLLNKKTNIPEKQNFVFYKINQCLGQLNCTLVKDENMSTDTLCHDVDDQYIFNSARKHNCKYICTYNVKDFPLHEIKAKTPHYILHEVDNLNIHNYIQNPILGRHGTILFIGTLHHKSSLGNIIHSSSGINVFTNIEGEICITGPSIKNIKYFSSLEGGIEQALSFRYNSTSFEADRWSYRNGVWHKEPLTRSNCNFSDDTRAQLIFCNEHNFFGHVQNISGIPRFVKDKQMQHVLSNNSLETAVGSLDLKYILDNTIITKKRN